MSFVIYKDSGGKTWLVDTDGIKRIIWSYARARAVYSRSHLSSDPQQMGPLGMFFPLTITTVQTNFNGIQGEVKSASDGIMAQLIPQISQSGQRAFESLVSYRHQTIEYNNKFRNMQQSASAQTNAAVNRVNRNVDTAMAVTKGIRDASADFVMIGATALSGGAMVAAVGGASLMKGTFTFQDKKMSGGSTQDAIAEGAIETTFDFTTSIIGVGKDAIAEGAVGASAAKGMLVVIGSTLSGISEFAKATIDGKSAAQALQSAGASAVLSGVGDVAGNALGEAFKNPSLAQWSFPVTISRSITQTVNLTPMVLNTSMTFGADHIAGALSAGGNSTPPSVHDSIAHTYLPQPNSDLIYVEQHAMRPKGV
ncbi:MAG: hypothetical protein ACLGSD_07650 [Acidobacteriota bacterium]